MGLWDGVRWCGKTARLSAAVMMAALLGIGPTASAQSATKPAPTESTNDADAPSDKDADAPSDEDVDAPSDKDADAPSDKDAGATPPPAGDADKDVSATPPPAGDADKDVSAPPSGSSPPNREMCLTAFDTGQDDRAKGRLISARDKFQLCSEASCPDLIRGKCAEWAAGLSRAVPSVVVGARDALGQDILNVTLSIDGKVVSTSMDGKPIWLDPGPHQVKLSADGYAIAEQTVLLKMGEQNRVLNVRLESNDPSTQPPGPLVEPKEPLGPTQPNPLKPQPMPPPRTSSYKPLTITSFAIAGGGLALGGIMGGIALSKAFDLNDQSCPNKECITPEAQDSLDSGPTFAHVSTAGFAIAGVGLAFGVVTLLLDDSGDEEISLLVGPDKFGLKVSF